MRFILFGVALIGCLCTTQLSWAQQSSADAATLIKQGIALFDQGHFLEATEHYKQALALDANNATARYELALTYNELGRFDDAVTECKKLLKQKPEQSKAFYSTYGNALDGLKKAKEAVKVYQEGLTLYPNEGPLYFNIAVTQAKSLQQLPEAIANMQQSVRCRPGHVNSHAALASLTEAQGNRIAALLVMMRQLQLEPEGQRAANTLTRLDKLIGKGVKQTGENNVTLNLSQDMLKQMNSKKSLPDNFAQADVLLTMAGALDFDEKNKNKTPTERFIEKITSMCQGLAEQKPAQQEGFMWQFYVPYFVEMQRQGHLPALAYAIQASRTDATPDVKNWLQEHATQVQVMQEWARTYSWPK